MKKLIVIGVLMVSLSLSGCVTWAHWGGRGRPPQYQQHGRFEQHHDEGNSGR